MDGVNWQLTNGQNFNWQLTNRWKSNWQLTFMVGFNWQMTKGRIALSILENGFQIRTVDLFFFPIRVQSLLHISRITSECHILLITTAWTIHIIVTCHISVVWSLIPNRLSTYAMAGNAGISKAVVSFYGIDSETAFKRHGSRIPINDVNTALALKKILTSFLGLKELSSK